MKEKKAKLNRQKISVLNMQYASPKILKRGSIYKKSGVLRQR